MSLVGTILQTIFKTVLYNEPYYDTVLGVTATNINKKRVNMKIELSAAHAGHLQDAWHYAMMIIDRRQSTFDDQEFPQGIRGQVLAYERLLGKLDLMAGDHETWQLVASKWWHPVTFENIFKNAQDALQVINDHAAALQIDARTGERIQAEAEAKQTQLCSTQTSSPRTARA